MVKLNNFGISKRCNVSEYSFVANGIVSRIQAYGVEKLHIHPPHVFRATSYAGVLYWPVV